MPEWKQEILKRLTPLRIDPAREPAIIEELAQHLEARYEELVSSGLDNGAAYQEALKELEHAEAFRRNCCGAILRRGLNRGGSSFAVRQSICGFRARSAIQLSLHRQSAGILILCRAHAGDRHRRKYNSLHADQHAPAESAASTGPGTPGYFLCEGSEEQARKRRDPSLVFESGRLRDEKRCVQSCGRVHFAHGVDVERKAPDRSASLLN